MALKMYPTVSERWWLGCDKLAGSVRSTERDACETHRRDDSDSCGHHQDAFTSLRMRPYSAFAPTVKHPAARDELRYRVVSVIPAERVPSFIDRPEVGAPQERPSLSGSNRLLVDALDVVPEHVGSSGPLGG